MEIKVAILSGVISFMIAIITAKLTIKSNKQKVIHENRMAVYCELSRDIDRLLMNRGLVFDCQFTDTLISYKSKIKLYGSLKVIKQYKAIVYLVHHTQQKYEQFSSENNPINDENNFVLDYDHGEGEEYERYIGTEDMEEDFKKACQIYKQECMPQLSIVQGLVDELHKNMRKDIGSK